MDDELFGEEEDGLASRPPTEDDLVSLCRELNSRGANLLFLRKWFEAQGRTPPN